MIMSSLIYNLWGNADTFEVYKNKQSFDGV